MKIKNYILELTVFICGALVMTYEIIGSRLVAPYIGTSTYVWTSLIGVILAALSLGYWLGGKTADRKPDVKILALVIFLAGGAVGVTIFFKDAVLSFISLSPLMLELKSVLAALILFAPASVLLGFVTPYAVKLKMSDIADAGKTVGRLYALSTVGSIVGTFSAGFFFIPFIGATRTLYVIAAALISLSLALAPFVISKTNLTLLVLFVFGIGYNELKSFYLARAQDYHEFDTEYSAVRIVTTDDEKSGRQIRSLTFDPFFVQSRMYLDSDEIVSEYVKHYHLIRHFKPDFKNTLMIGGAGYSFPKAYLEKYPNAEMQVVEIDPQMTEIAKKYFRLADNPRLKIAHEDGRIFLNNAETAKYDAVLMDAFGSLFSIPFQLTTVEAAEQIDRVLTGDGIVIFNAGGALAGKPSRFLQAEIATYKKIFPQVFVFKVAPEKQDSETQNIIIAASKSRTPISFNSDDAEIKNLLSHLYAKDFHLTAPVLTDELAPVEYYNSFAQSSR